MNIATKEQVAAKIREILSMQGYPEDEPMGEELNLTSDMGMDSLDKVEMIMNAEKMFNISIPDEDAEKLETIGAITKYLLELKVSV